MPCIALAALLLGMLTPVTDRADWWRPQPGIAWDIQFAIDPDAELGLPDEPIRAIDLDGVDTASDTVAKLHDNGIRTICYVNVGAREEWRPDAGAYPGAILGRPYPGWPGERFVDIRALGTSTPDGDRVPLLARGNERRCRNAPRRVPDLRR